LFDGPPRDEKFRTRLCALIARGGLRHLHSWLARVDPESAVRIMPRDIPRIVRALEVYVLTGITLSRHFRSDRKPLQGWNIIKLGLNPPREELYQRINDRVQEMLASGWINEVRALLESGVNPHAQAFAALGYRRVVEHLQGRLELAAMVSCIQADTRHYAKRQWTWFRKDRDIHWLDGFGAFPEVQQTAAEWLANEL
jgi:tRNA dimethylallyltransferase